MNVFIVSKAKYGYKFYDGANAKNKSFPKLGVLGAGTAVELKTRLIIIL